MGKLRITSGTFGGRYIQTQDSSELRPTTERVREALFSSLVSSGSIADARVLDLYAGSGILGLESLSRGAGSLDCVERHKGRARLIESNAAQLGCRDKVRVMSQDVLQFLGANTQQKETFTLVFADPPYAELSFLSLFEKILSSGLLAESATLVIEGPVEQTEEFNSAPQLDNSAMKAGFRLSQFKVKGYGTTILGYYFVTRSS